MDKAEKKELIREIIEVMAERDQGKEEKVLHLNILGELESLGHILEQDNDLKKYCRIIALTMGHIKMLEHYIVTKGQF